MRTRILILIAFSMFIHDVSGQIGRLFLSPIQKVEQKIGVTDVSLVYSRPSMRGREIFGGLVPYGEPWRTGANRNTTIEFSEDVLLDGARIVKGKYALFSIPYREQWEIIFYTDTDNWDVPEELEEEKIAGKIMVPSEGLPKEKEALSITIADFTNYAFGLKIAWSNTSVTVPIDLITKEIMDKKIDRVLSGPSYDDYYAAALYQMESGHEYEKGLAWINKGIALKEETTWWDLRLKAILLLEMGRLDEARQNAEKGMAMAKAVKREYGINEFNIILKKLNR